MFTKEQAEEILENQEFLRKRLSQYERSLSPEKLDSILNDFAQLEMKVNDIQKREIKVTDHIERVSVELWGENGMIKSFDKICTELNIFFKAFKWIGGTITTLLILILVAFAGSKFTASNERSRDKDTVQVIHYVPYDFKRAEGETKDELPSR